MVAISMKKYIFVIIIVCFALSGCWTNLWTAGSAIYNRHQLYNKMTDISLAAKVSHALYTGRALKQKFHTVEIAVFNRDLLMAGGLPTDALRQEAMIRVATVAGFRHIYNRIAVTSNADDSVKDSWITTSLRSQIVADSSIDPDKFKVITSDQIVYLMGDVMLPQAEKVIQIARNIDGVKQVVSLLQCYQLSNKGLKS